MKKKILLVAFYLPAFAFVIFNESHAQSLTDIKTQLVKDWERAKAYTADYLNTMPADKYSFRATDSIRSFAQQMLHLAQAIQRISSVNRRRYAICIHHSECKEKPCHVYR